MPKYSFVIPVYNCSLYIDQCIQSVLAQTYMDYEIILIDDGSEDNSGTICDSYSEQHKNIKMIHITNSGASVARNTGMQHAQGDYIIFLDSDDYWIDPQGLEKIDNLVSSEVDVVIFPSYTYYENSGELIADRYNYPEFLNHMDSEDCLLYMIEHDLFNTHACKKVHKRDFLVKNDLFFKPGIRTEDVELEIRVANCLPRYRFFNEKLYVYRQRENSVTASIDACHLDEFLHLIEQIAENTYVTDNVRDAILSYDAYQLSLLLAHMGKLRKDDRKRLLDGAKKNAFLFRYTLYPRTKQVAVFYRLFGMNLTQKALSDYLKRKSMA